MNKSQKKSSNKPLYSSLNIRLKYILIFVLLFIFSLPAVLAETKQVNLEAEIMNIQSEAVGQELVGPLAKLFGDEKINVHLSSSGVSNSGSSNSEETIIGIVTEDKKIKALGLNPVKEPTLDVFTDEKTAAKILVSKNPLPPLQKALGEKKITYKANGLFHKMKLGLLGIFVDVLKGADAGGNEEFEVEIVHSQPKTAEEKAVEEKKAEEKKVADKEGPEAAAKEENKDTLTGNAVADVKPPQSAQTVEMNNNGFSPEVVTIKKGETIQFKNTRTGGRLSQLIGTQACRAVKSSKLSSGDTFDWTFDTPLKCFFTDAYMTTKTVKVVVE